MGGWCLIVTEEDLMRGVDYRIGEKGDTKSNDGIDLLLAAPFSNERACDQGHARVGRYTEPCTRYGLQGLERVDPKKAAMLKLSLASRGS